MPCISEYGETPPDGECGPGVLLGRCGDGAQEERWEGWDESNFQSERIFPRSFLSPIPLITHSGFPNGS